jgi:hypothetical protein
LWASSQRFSCSSAGGFLVGKCTCSFPSTLPP